MLASRWDFTERRRPYSEKPLSSQNWQQLTKVSTMCKTRADDTSVVCWWSVGDISAIYNDQNSIHYRPINCSRWRSPKYRSIDSRLTYGPKLSRYSIEVSTSTSVDTWSIGQKIRLLQTFALVVEAFIFVPYFTLLTSCPHQTDVLFHFWLFNFSLVFLVVLGTQLKSHTTLVIAKLVSYFTIL